MNQIIDDIKLLLAKRRLHETIKKCEEINLESQGLPYLPQSKIPEEIAPHLYLPADPDGFTRIPYQRLIPRD